MIRDDSTILPNVAIEVKGLFFLNMFFGIQENLIVKKNLF